MIKLGMVGKVLIHNYPYGAWFNGADDDVLEERCTKRWMLELIRGRFPEPASSRARITHVWAGERVEAEAIAASCRIGNVCDSAEEVIAAVDGVLVLDEDIEHRTRLVRQSLQAGRGVYVDKIPSLDPAEARELVELAQAKGVPRAAWSQLLMAREAAPFRELQGGAGLVTFNLAPDIVDKYGVHLVCAAFAAFGADPVHMAAVDTGETGAPTICLSYADGKDVILRAGTDVPPRGHVCHVSSKNGASAAALMDMEAMFDASAAALDEMFATGQWPLPPEAIVGMTRAAALLCG